MIFHLESEHKISFKKSSHGEAETTQTGSAPKQMKITSFSSNSTCSTSTRLSKEKELKIENALMSLFLDKMLPISLVDHESFRHLINELEPRYKLPGRKSVLCKISDMYNKVMLRLKKEVNSSPHVALTHDSWTSLATESYDTVTAHYITEDWDMRSVVLRTSKLSGSHTGENISASLSACLKEWNIHTPVFVTDNAANEIKAIRMLGCPRLGCYGHRLNLVVKHALNDPETAKLITKGRSVVTFFHTSTSATEVLQQKQKLLLPEEHHDHRLISDVVTRWNSTLAMLIRLDEQQPALNAVATDTVLGKRGKELLGKLYSFEEQLQVKSLISVLNPFKKATDMLSGDTKPTLGLVLPVLVKLCRVLEVCDDDSDMIKTVKQDMQKQLDVRTADKELPLKAALLTPSLKKLNFSSAEEQKRAETLVYDELCSLYDSQSVVHVKKEKETDENGNLVVAEPMDPPLPQLPLLEGEEAIGSSSAESPTPPKKQKVDIKQETVKPLMAADWLEDVICVSVEKPPPPGTMAEKELSSYLAEPASHSRYCSDLDWWKAHEMKFRNLAILAKKYLCIPSSSVSAERVFSLTGNIISKKRARLKAELVEKIVFLNKNKFLL